MASNVESIESRLKNCSLSGDNQSHPPPPQPMPMPAQAQNIEEVPVPEPVAPPHQNMEEAPPVRPNSEAPLPPNWSQYDDLCTGEKYYINWDSNMRTNVDPRVSEAEAKAAGYYLSDDENWSEYFVSEEEGTEGDSSTGDSGNSIFIEPAQEGTMYLIVAGCGTCMHYYMVPENAVNCSRCGSPLIHIPPSGSV